MWFFYMKSWYWFYWKSQTKGMEKYGFCGFLIERIWGKGGYKEADGVDDDDLFGGEDVMDG